MCGSDSARSAVQETVVTKKDGSTVKATSTKLFFLVDENGVLGTSHSEIGSVAKIAKNVKTFDVQPEGDGFYYEDGAPAKAIQTRIEKQMTAMLASMKKLGPAYAKKLVAAKAAQSKKLAANQAAFDKANAAALASYEAAKKTAFAPIAKLGGIAK